MRSALDESISAHLRTLPGTVAPTEAPSVVLKRIAELATHHAIEAAFQERLVTSDAAVIGCSKNGALTRAGRMLNAIRVEEFLKVDSRQETLIRACACIGDSVRLSWSFHSDEQSATFRLRSAPEVAPPVDLVNVQAWRCGESDEHVAAEVIASVDALRALDRQHLRSGLDPASLCHTLIGMLPEFYGEEWEIYEKAVESLLRHRNRGERRMKLSRRWWLRRDRWWRRRLLR